MKLWVFFLPLVCLCNAQWPFKNTRQYTIPTFTNGRYKHYGYNQPQPRRPSYPSQQSPSRPVSSSSFYRGTPQRNYFPRPVSSVGASNTWLKKPSSTSTTTSQWFTPSTSSSSVARPQTSSFIGKPFVSQGTAVPIKIRPKMPQLVEETQYTPATITTVPTTPITTTTESTTTTTESTTTTTESTTTTTTETTTTETQQIDQRITTSTESITKPLEFEAKGVKKPAADPKKEDNKEYERFQNWIKANNALSSRPIHATSSSVVITTQAPQKVIQTISSMIPTTDTPSVKANQTSEDDHVLTVSDVKPQLAISSKTFTPPSPPISTATETQTESVTSRTVKRIRTELANRNFTALTALRPVNQRIRFSRPRTPPAIRDKVVKTRISSSSPAYNRYKSVYFTRNNVNRNRFRPRPSLSTTTEASTTTTLTSSTAETTTKVPFWRKKFKLGKRPALYIAEKNQTSESTTTTPSSHQIKQFTNVLVTRPTYVVVSTTSASLPLTTTATTTASPSFLPTLRTSTTTTTTTTTTKTTTTTTTTTMTTTTSTTTTTTTTTTTATPFSALTTSPMSIAKTSTPTFIGISTVNESLEALTNIAEVKMGSTETTTHRIPAKVFKPYPAINKPSYQHTPEKTKSAASGITIIEAAKVVEITTAKPHQPKSFDVMDDFFDRYYRDGWKDEDFKMAENVPDFLRHAVPMPLLPPVSLRRMDSFATRKK